MVTKTLDLKRNRTITTEIMDDGYIVIEITKDSFKPGYKNGESDYHEVCLNLTQTEVTEMVDFLIETLEDYKEKFGVKEIVNG